MEPTTIIGRGTVDVRWKAGAGWLVEARTGLEGSRIGRRGSQRVRGFEAWLAWLAWGPNNQLDLDQDLCRCVVGRGTANTSFW